MILYFDTSSLVKVYVEETGSAQIRQLFEQSQVVATSRIAYVEARSAFARKFRERGLTESVHRSIVKGFDALHLASAAYLRREAGRPVTFSCFDGRLLKVAQREGLLVATY